MDRAPYEHLPGGALILQGIEDVAAGRESPEACLALIGKQRLAEAGLSFAGAGLVSELAADRRLYELLGALHGREAHARYNSLLRELVSFERALERQQRREVGAGGTADPS